MKKKQGRKKKSTSIFLRIFVPLLILVIMQAAVLYAVLSVRGVFRNLNENSLCLLEESTKNKQQVLISSMVNDWSNLLTTEEVITDLVEDVLSKRGEEWDDIKVDAELNTEIITRSTDVLISRLRSCKTTGIFMVLDGIAVTGDLDSYAGFYVRDADPYSNPNDQSDLLMLRGLPMVAREKNLSLNSFWKSYFIFDGGAGNEDNRFFYNPLLAARDSKSTRSEYFGYWCPSFNFGDSSDQKVITYSIPLISGEGNVYGVLGVEVNEAFLSQLISNERYGGRESCFYYLGIEDSDELSFQKVTSSGDRFGLDDFSGTEDKITKDHRFVEMANRKGEVLYGAVEKLKLYNSNTPFEDEQWVIIGLQEQSTLFKASAEAKSIISLSLVITVLLGVFVSIIGSRSIVKPITSLVQSVRNGSDNSLDEIPHAVIQEIDELADAIELRNREIMESAVHTSELIELSGLPVGVYEVNEAIGKVYCSKGFFSLLNVENTGLDEEHMTSSQLEQILDCVRQNSIGNDIYELMKNDRKIYVRLVNHRDKNGEIGAVMDVTKEVNERFRIEHERDFDSLTGIWNRRSFENKMDSLFGDHRDQLGNGALIMLDLDNLKYINDAYGHDCGDDYICTFASALKKCANPHTLLARRSGDEFYLFTYGYATKEEAAEAVKGIWERAGDCTLALPDDSSFKVRFSGGVSWYPKDASMPSKLIHYADFAMYQVKHSQKGSIQAFDIREYKENSFLFDGHDSLNRLIDQKLVRFVFQPIYSAKTGDIFGYELLMRSDVDKLKMPDVILKMAKSQGKLHHIEYITWIRAMETIREMQKKDALPKNSMLFINSIANQTLFREEEEDIVKDYRDLLPHVMLEVTESEDNNMDYTRRKLAFIRGNGGQVAIDDFGTGYNSELALVMIPADVVKIDISFVRNVDSDPDKQTLIRNLISYAKQRGIAVLAEGVETQNELKVLVDFGVDYLQGFYLGKPSCDPVKEMPENLKTELISIQK